MSPARPTAAAVPNVVCLSWVFMLAGDLLAAGGALAGWRDSGARQCYPLPIQPPLAQSNPDRADDKSTNFNFEFLQTRSGVVTYEGEVSMAIYQRLGPGARGLGGTGYKVSSHPPVPVPSESHP